MVGAGAAWIPLKDNLALFGNLWPSCYNWHKLDRAVWRYLDRSLRASLFGSPDGARDIGLGHAGRATRHFTSPPQHLIPAFRRVFLWWLGIFSPACWSPEMQKLRNGPSKRCARRWFLLVVGHKIAE
jgi:hypothetical protein